ncbi:hypothetical protein PbB2_02978 [Candidatus Phycosocius bacilliformis]|uniref:Probable membrane transporter protein n=1 Tax=Candidatus Phycosocius bacilliformis TaxID=1445552 RepID=A0A2P2EE02_9PROT|nr:sulfite exporter TauE/SafE family protein [Candidatus Phycosocius bacilliformis]GBF59284.1 hypothetical protein PbB2_02978 [Candidatus Phycosocius bacilliformis]
MIDFVTQHLHAIWPFILVGFVAQLVDGALGMAFGVITSTLLVSVLGMPPARASSTVHIVEVFTTAASAISHALHRNVNWRLFATLVIPGMIGGITGAYLLSNIHAEVARPFVMGYLACIGLYLLWRAWRMAKGQIHRSARFAGPLGLVGGFLDAVGGGGWGPVVTSNLLVQGTDPRMTIGTVNTAEFFLTTVISAVFIVNLGWEAFTLATLGLIAGGLLAAPFGAILAKRVPARQLLFLVGTVLTLTSLFSLSKALGLV